MRLQRYSMGDHSNCIVEDDDGQVLMGTDVDQLESKCSELEAKCSELEASHAELLVAAKDVMRLLAYFVVTTEYFKLTTDRLRAAIAKAEGEELP